MPDFNVHREGSVLGLTPVSEGAQEWIKENVSIEPYQWMGSAFYGDTRVMCGLLEVLADAGFTLGG